MLKILALTGAALMAVAVYCLHPADWLACTFALLATIGGLLLFRANLRLLCGGVFGVSAAYLFGVTLAFAADVAVAPQGDFTSLAAQVLEAVIAVALPPLLYLVHRLVNALGQWVRNNTAQLHLPIIEQAVAEATDYVNQVIDAAGSNATLTTRNAAINSAVLLILQHAGASTDALGLTHGDLVARLNLALGAPPATLPLALTQPAPPSVDDIVAAIKTAMGPPAPAPAADAPAPAAANPVIGTAAAALALLVIGLGLQGCAAAGIAADVAAARPIAADIACWSQSAANVTTDALSAAGDTAGAAKSAEVSAITGAACTAINSVRRDLAPDRPTALASK